MGKVYLVGCDLGTMGAKAAIYDTEGHLIADAYEETPIRYPKAGWAEQDLDEIYGCAVRTIARCVEKSGINTADVAALAFSSQMSGIGMIDRNWRPVAHFDSWLDTRCEPYIQVMSEHAREITALNGCPPTYAHGPKILWWKHEEPEAYRAIHKFVVPSGYVAGRFAGLPADEAFIDDTVIHFSGFADLQNRRWSDDLLNLYGVDGAKLPRIVRPTEIIGRLTAEAARATGLREGTPIAAGAGDQAAGSLGAGVVDPGDAFDSAGTAACFSICVGDFKPDVENQMVLCARTAIDGRYYALSFIQGGGLNLRWFRDEFAAEEKARCEAAGESIYAYLDRLASEVPAGAGGAIFLPHVQGRVLPPTPYLRGAWVGFTWHHNKAALFRAILEAVAFEYASYLRIEQDLVPGLTCREVNVIGGGANSELWCQIKADVLGADYCKLQWADVGTLGCALVAGAAVGIYSDLAAVAKRMATTTERIRPRPEYHAFYQPYVRAYGRLLRELNPLFAELAALPRELSEVK